MRHGGLKFPGGKKIGCVFTDHLDGKLYSATFVRFHHSITLAADKRIVNNIMKVYIESPEQLAKILELIRYHTFFYFIHVYFCKATDSMQHSPPNTSGSVEHKPIRLFSDSLGPQVNAWLCVFKFDKCRVTVHGQTHYLFLALYASI